MILAFPKTGRAPTLEKGQEPYTKGARAASSNNLKALKEQAEEDQEATMKFIVAAAKQPPLSENGNNADMVTTIANLRASGANSTAALITAESGEQVAQAAREKKADLAGKEVMMSNTRAFSGKAGDMVNFSYNIGNVPKNAIVSGTITVLDDQKRKVASRKIHYMNQGANEFNWDGFDDNLGELVAEGSYSIEVTAQYKMPGDKTSHNAPANAMTKYKILEVNTRTGMATLSNHTKVPLDEIETYLAPTSSEKAEDKRDINSEVAMASSLHGRMIRIKENSIRFEGNNVDIGFNAPRDIKNAEVKIVAMQNGEAKAIDKQTMDLTEGRNTILWAGFATKNDQEFKDRKAGHAFSKLPQGEYEYQIYATSPGGPLETMSATSEVRVDSVEFTGLGNNLILAGGSKVPDSAFDGFVLNETRSADELSAIVNNVIGKHVQMPRIAKFDGTNPYSRIFRIAYETDVQMSLEMHIQDQDGNPVNTVKATPDDVDKALALFATYDNLDDAAQAKVIDWMSPPQNNFAEFAAVGSVINYSNLAPDNKDFVDQHIIAQVRAEATESGTGYKLKEGYIPSIQLEWDGKDKNGDVMPAGNYHQYYSYTTTNTDTGENYSFSEPKHVGVKIVQASHKDGQVNAKLQDNREITITGNEIYVAG